MNNWIKKLRSNRKMIPNPKNKKNRIINPLSDTKNHLNQSELRKLQHLVIQERKERKVNIQSRTVIKA